MKNLGWILAVVGLIVAIVGLADHYTHFVLSSMAHASIILGVVGLVVLVVGAAMTRMGGQSA